MVGVGDGRVDMGAMDDIFATRKTTLRSLRRSPSEVVLSLVASDGDHFHAKTEGVSYLSLKASYWD